MLRVGGSSFNMLDPPTLFVPRRSTQIERQTRYALGAFSGVAVMARFLQASLRDRSDRTGCGLQSHPRTPSSGPGR